MRLFYPMFDYGEGNDKWECGLSCKHHLSQAESTESTGGQIDRGRASYKSLIVQSVVLYVHRVMGGGVGMGLVRCRPLGFDVWLAVRGTTRPNACVGTNGRTGMEKYKAINGGQPFEYSSPACPGSADIPQLTREKKTPITTHENGYTAPSVKE